MDGFLASWMPKIGGLIVFLGVLFGQLSRQFDSDPATICDWTVIYAAGVTFVTFLSVRQNGVSSEQAHAGVIEPVAQHRGADGRFDKE